MLNYSTLKPYLHRSIEDWGGVVSDDFKTFSRKWRNLLSKMCKEHQWQLVKFNSGHYYCSWFIKDQNDHYIYCSFSDVRYFSKEWYKLILYRTAKNDRDYTGGSNNYTDLDTLDDHLVRCFMRF